MKNSPSHDPASAEPAREAPPKPLTQAKRIEGLRRRLLLTRQQFAILFGVHATTVGRWERGTEQPSSTAAMILEQALLQHHAVTSVVIEIVNDAMRAGHPVDALARLLNAVTSEDWIQFAKTLPAQRSSF